MDQRWLRQRPPGIQRPRGILRVVDLFSGCGGLSLGLVEAARREGLRTDIRLAIDLDDRALRTFTRNLDVTLAIAGKVEETFDGQPGCKPSLNERRTANRVGDVDLLVGGPPCQGHSDLNNSTRRDDPRNALYLRMARAAE